MELRPEFKAVAEAQVELRAARQKYEFERARGEEEIIQNYGGEQGVKGLGANLADQARSFTILLEADMKYTQARELFTIAHNRLDRAVAELEMLKFALREAELNAKNIQLGTVIGVSPEAGHA